MLTSVFTSVLAYISTNIDDLFINMLFFAQARSTAQTRSLFAGKYLGVMLLTVVSLLGAWGLQTFPASWLKLLGMVPMALGIREIIRSLRGAKEEEMSPKAARTLWLSMAATTIASGADNIGVYLPLFAGFSPWQMGVAIAVFALMTGLWCFISNRLTDLPGLRSLLARCKSVVIPIVYILLGLSILL